MLSLSRSLRQRLRRRFLCMFSVVVTTILMSFMKSHFHVHRRSRTTTTVELSRRARKFSHLGNLIKE